MKKTTTRLLALSLCLALTVLTGCGSSKNQFKPPENPYDSLNLSEYVTLPDYNTYKTKALDVTVTDEQIEAEIESRLEAAATTEKVTEGSVEKGDKVEISYHGTLEDGTTEDGMNSDSYTLTLGEASMIDGFQEAIYGAKIGETITANLKFPDPYEMNKELSGKKVTFEIKVLSKEVTVPAALDEEFVKANSEAKTVDEFRTLVAEELKTEAEDSQRADYENEIFNQIVEESEIIKYPEEQVQAEMDKLDEQYKNLASQNGMEWEDVLENSLKLTQEEYDEIAAWFSGAIHRYRPSYADPAKGGNFDLARYNTHPEEYWSLWKKYAKRYPRVYIEAFFANCMGIWYPDDTTHAHTLDTEDWDNVYLRTVNVVPEMVGEVTAHSYLPAYRTWIYNSTHHSRHENVPLYSQLFKPSTYVYLLLALTLLLLYRRERRWALCTLPVWGIILSLLFSACILIRYSYPFMVCVPMLALLILFSNRRPA